MLWPVRRILAEIVKCRMVLVRILETQLSLEQGQSRIEEQLVRIEKRLTEVVDGPDDDLSSVNIVLGPVSEQRQPS